MDGLGIDFGSPLEPARDGEQSRTQRAIDRFSSLNEFNHAQSSSPLRPSGMPDDRNRRLSLAVAKMQDGDDGASSIDSATDASLTPRTDASGSSAPMADYEPQGSMQRKAAFTRALMTRSQSAYAVPESGADADISASNTSLGRSNATGRSTSRSQFRAKRLASAPDVHALSQSGTEEQVEPSTSTSSMPRPRMQRTRSIPDGFGGFTDVEEDVDDDDEAGDVTVVPTDDEEGREYQPHSINASVSMQDLPSSRPDRRQDEAEYSRARAMSQRVPLPRSISQPARSFSSSASQGSLSASSSRYRVGSFYGPDGSENARIDENGELYRLDDDGDSSCVEDSEVSASSSSSRSSGPRSAFMSSPVAERPKRRSHARGRSDVSAVSTSVISSASSRSQTLDAVVNMRSERGFQGLSGAERGEAFVSMDLVGKSFAEGSQIRPKNRRHEDDVDSLLMSAQPESEPTFSTTSRQRQASAPVLTPQHRAMPQQTIAKLDRNGTLISAGANPARRSQDLSRLLGKGSGKLGGAAAARSGHGLAPIVEPQAALEQTQAGRSRVDVDVVLESDLAVEGGLLKGRLDIKVRDKGYSEDRLMLSQPKVRVVGFEEILNDDTRHIFYHYSTVIEGFSSTGSSMRQPYVLHGSPHLSPELTNWRPLPCFASPPDAEGYCAANEGVHSVPFSLDLPIGKGAKGSFRGKNAAVRYIVIGSIKLKSLNGQRRSIAHFYRHIDLHPYLNPAVILSSAARPLVAQASKSLFMGGSGKVNLVASLHRQSWVAGQRLYVSLRVENDTSKQVKNLSFALMRDVTIYKPKPEFDLAGTDDADACSTTTTRKRIAEDTLEMGQKGTKGQVTARGWWTGVAPGEAMDISHHMMIPHDALSIIRGRHLGVAYYLKVSANSSLSADVSVELPVRIVNFVSLDPPPQKSLAMTTSQTRLTVQSSTDEGLAVERIRSADALRSPQPDERSQQHRTLAPSRPQNARLAPPSNGVEDQARNLQHQRSLDFINHAIRSATARRAGPEATAKPAQRMPQGLGIDIDDDPVDPTCRPYVHVSQADKPASSQHPSRGRAMVPEYEYDDEDDGDLGVGHQTLNLNDESVADIDLAIESAPFGNARSSAAFVRLHPSDESFEAAEPAQRDDTTPLARSPPKFDGNIRKRRSIPGAYAYMDSPSEAGAPSDFSEAEGTAFSGSSTSSSSAARKLVRTGSDFGADLGRSSTIIRGPSAVARPVSPSKQAPSPTKSAMKSSATSVPPVVRAKVERNPIARPVLTASVSQPQIPSHRSNLAQRKPVHSAADSDSEASSAGYGTSPATSAGLSTPPDVHTMTDGVNGNKAPPHVVCGLESGMQGLGIQMGLPTAAISVPQQAPSVPEKDKETRVGVPRSNSAHTIRGASVVVPSVRDKIAQLENRKRALQDFSVSQPSRSSTPRAEGDLPSSASFKVLPPSQAILARHGSVQSNSSSIASSMPGAPDYLRNVGSLTSLKAPLFR